MKATILHGALTGDSFVDAAGAVVHEALRAEGWTVTPWILRDEKIAYCLGCFECWTRTPACAASTTPAATWRPASSAATW